MLLGWFGLLGRPGADRHFVHSHPSTDADANAHRRGHAADDLDLDVDELVTQVVAAVMPDAWQERFVIGYGPGNELLGTSPGGDSGPDGTWWFLDAAKARLAHFDASGRYLDQVRIPRTMLVQGVYCQWQLPHVLADGTLLYGFGGRGKQVVVDPTDGSRSCRSNGSGRSGAPAQCPCFVGSS